MDDTAVTSDASAAGTDRTAALARIDAMADTWRRCRTCRAWSGPATLRSHGVCHTCGSYFPLPAHRRIAQIADPGSFEERDADLRGGDPLGFTDQRTYQRRLEAARERTDLSDAAVFGTCRIAAQPAVLLVIEPSFMGGTMGRAVGEKFARAAELAAQHAMPLIVVSSSGGGRIQEGVYALFQGVKTSAAVGHLNATGTPYISVLTDPVFGGVAVSFSSIGDIVIAERGARVGFTGRRVIERTIGRKLPARFQTAEFLLEHGHVDQVAARTELPGLLGRLVAFTSRPDHPLRAARCADSGERGPAPESDAAATDAWEAVGLARSPHRPRVPYYVDQIFNDVLELHGDRAEGDDPALIAGLARLEDTPVVFLGHRRGAAGSGAAYNNGMASPCGYRKAIRALNLADRWQLPLLTLVDTPGAFPGTISEERNQNAAIAETMRTASQISVPLVCAVTGEGGSGGALALCVGDRLLLQQNAVLSVISPEGAAAVLYTDAGQAPHMAQQLGLRAHDLAQHQLIDAVVPEPPGGAEADPEAAAALLKAALVQELEPLLALSRRELTTQRAHRLRAFGGTLHAPPPEQE